MVAELDTVTLNVQITFMNPCLILQKLDLGSTKRLWNTQKKYWFSQIRYKQSC
jgi:hypothetical protein